VYLNIPEENTASIFMLEMKQTVEGPCYTEDKEEMGHRE